MNQSKTVISEYKLIILAEEKNCGKGENSGYKMAKCKNKIADFSKRFINYFSATFREQQYKKPV